jgi:CRP-like cAMP-binding protein
MFVLSRLKEAGVRLSERRFEVGEVIYSHGDPDRYLYFLTEGVLKLYKGYGGYKEAIVTLLEEGNVFGVPELRSRGAQRDSAEALMCSRVAAVGQGCLGRVRAARFQVRTRTPDRLCSLATASRADGREAGPLGYQGALGECTT